MNIIDDDPNTEELVADGLALELQRTFRHCAGYEDRWRHVANKAHDLLVEPEPHRVAREKRERRAERMNAYAWGIGTVCAAIAVIEPPFGSVAIVAVVAIIIGIAFDIQAARSR